MVEVIPYQVLARIGGQPSRRLINRSQELIRIRMKAFSGGEHRLVELTPILPLLTTRNGQSIRLEVRHSLALQIRIGRVTCRRVIEHAPDSVQIEHYQRLRFEQVNVEIVALVLLPEPPNQIYCERVGM